jgi:hypothetical protein
MPSPASDLPQRDPRDKPEPPSDECASAPARTDAQAGLSAEQKLLDQVLAQTVTALAGGESHAPEFVQDMRQIAGRHRGEAVTAAAVATELIEAALQYAWPAWARAADDRRQLLNDIVDLLLNDSPSRARLEKIWEKLSKAGP